MTGDDLTNLLSFILIELCPARTQQNRFSSQAKSEDLAEQGMGLQNGFCIIRVAPGLGRVKPGQMRMHGVDNPIVDQLIGGSGRKLLA